MLNHIVIMGRLVKDPELHKTATDVPVSTIRLAVDRDFRDKDTGHKESDFFSATVWRKDAEYVCDTFSKGDIVVVEGRMQTRQYTDSSQVNRTVYEIVTENIYPGSPPKKSRAYREQDAGAVQGGMEEDTPSEESDQNI